MDKRSPEQKSESLNNKALRSNEHHERMCGGGPYGSLCLSESHR